MQLSLLLSCLGASAALTASLQRRQTLGPSNSTASYRFGTPGVNATYDYVIVGGGTAGLALATRLAENPSLTVAVLEAGGFYEAFGNTSTIPAYDIFFTGTNPNDTNPNVDWGFVTEPQAGANGRRMHYARGKTLGGSSARNYMLYHRPTVGSMLKWAKEVGDSTYTFSKILPYFKKSVHYTPPSIPYKNSTNVQDSAGFDVLTGNPLEVSFGKYEDPFGTWSQRAFEFLNAHAIKGFQVGKLIGSAYIAFTENPTTGKRSSSQSSFLASSKSPNLHVYNYTLAKRIQFSGAQNEATGVIVSPSEAILSGSTYILHARKEVVVSAGAFQSPQLLMVSGIGSRDILINHSIPVLKDLPGVGQNLQDQPFFGSSYRVGLSTASAALNNATLNLEAIKAFNQLGAGPLTNPITPVIGFENLPDASLRNLNPNTRLELTHFPADWPQIEFLPAGAVLNTRNLAAGDPVNGHNYASISTALITVLSRGNVSISSADTLDPPLINPNWLTDPADRDLAIAAFKRQRDFWAYMKNHSVAIGEEYKPGPSVNTDAEIMAYIEQTVAPIWHAAATCKMGPSDDKMAVVDSQARVYGTQRLRVVDASAFPFLPPGHPQSTVYALAEKIADVILGTPERPLSDA